MIHLTAYPNPFTQNTTVDFKIPMDSQLKVDIYTTTGILVRSLYDGYAEKNRSYSFVFSGNGHMFSETYICVIRTDYGTKHIRLMMSR